MEPNQFFNPPPLLQSKPLQRFSPLLLKRKLVLSKEGWACVPTSWDAKSLLKSDWMLKIFFFLFDVFRNLPQTEIDIWIAVIPVVVKYYIAFGVFVFFLMFSNIMAMLPLAEESGHLQNK